jgi:hypothetical protein
MFGARATLIAILIGVAEGTVAIVSEPPSPRALLSMSL